MTILQMALLPFSVIYQLITSVRNWLYEKGYKKSMVFPLPVVSVGNLTVGGTGKTPHIEYLIRLLKDQIPLATLSRGYGRQTKGYRTADASASAATMGDEPMQFYHKFGNDVIVAVGEKRALAIAQIVQTYSQTGLILLDDAFQHRAVTPTFSILLSDYHRPFYKDYVLPSGRLRESRKGARRADVVIVSKCPPLLTAKEGVAITSQIRKYSQAAAPVYFTGIQYGQPLPYHGHDEQPDFALSRVLLVSGVANPMPLEHYVQSHYRLVHHIRFKDHHTYTGQDVLRMQKNLVHYQADVILTTEKDYVKLMQPAFETRVAALAFYYLPMEVCFLFGHKEAFDKYLWQALNHKKTNY